MEVTMRGKQLTWLIASLGALAFILQGYDQALMNGIIVLEQFVKVFPAIDTVNTKGAAHAHASTLEGTVVALYEVGSAAGALSCYFIGDRLGRRKTIWLASCIIMIGVVLQSTPFELAQLIVARIVTGVGVGMFTATIPVWVSECSKAHNRGKLVMLSGSCAIFGVCLVTWMELGFYFVKDSEASWRFPIAFQAVFALVVFSCILFLPESPRWLVSKERREEAAGILGRLDDLPSDSAYVREDIAIIHRSIEAEHGGASRNPFARTENKQLWRTMLALSINMLAQMTGVNIISFYSDTIFTQILGYDDVTARIIGGCLQTWQFFCASLAVLFIDRFGRRPLLIFCALGMMVSHAGFAGLTSQSSNQAAAGASLLFDFIALFCFPVGLFLVPFLYTAEIAPLGIRAKVAAMGSSVNWLFNFLLAEITPFGFDSIGWRYWLVYMCTSATCALVVYFFAPETKGRSLEDIDELFIAATSPFDVVKQARRLKATDGPGARLEREEGITSSGCPEKDLECVSGATHLEESLRTVSS